ncbi:MAG: hypothetical protein ACREM6_13760 [Vulcanimicrobiaceae bacterium]
MSGIGSSYVFRAEAVRFERDGIVFAPPFTMALRAGDTIAVDVPDAGAARVVARLAGGIVKATGGTIFIGDYNPRLQPIQAKRLVAFVDGDCGLAPADRFECELSLRADLWRVERSLAAARAQRVRAALGDGGYARGVALACVAGAPLFVLDRPPEPVVARLAAVFPTAAIFATRVGVRAALDAPEARIGAPIPG